MYISSPSSYYGTNNNEVQVGMTFTPSFDANDNLLVKVDLFDSDPSEGTPVDSVTINWQGAVNLSGGSVSASGNLGASFGQISYNGIMVFKGGVEVKFTAAPIGIYDQFSTSSGTSEFMNNTSITRITGRTEGTTGNPELVSIISCEVASNTGKIQIQLNEQQTAEYITLTNANPTSKQQNIEVNGANLSGVFSFENNHTIYFNGNIVQSSLANIGFINGVVGGYFPNADK